MDYVKRDLSMLINKKGFAANWVRNRSLVKVLIVYSMSLGMSLISLVLSDT
jgi:hypothetical protein